MQIIKMSSAYKLILGSVLWNLRPDSPGKLRIVPARGSIRRAKIYGERGQPCLVPLVMGKEWEKKPEVKTVVEGEVYSEVIASKIGTVNPNLYNTLHRYDHLIFFF